MQTLIDNGIAFIVALQGMGDWLIFPMKLFSNLGTEEFYFLVLPLIYWCVDSALGLRVGLILVTSNILNGMGKVLLAGPRPYWVSSHVRALWPETSFGIPSGHAQHAVSVWGIIAAYYEKMWVWVVALALIFLIGFSRLYLGSHFPHDVLLGWFLGVLLLWAFTHFWEPIAKWLGAKPLYHQIFIAFIVSMIFIMLGLGATAFRGDYQVPQDWINNTLLAGTDLPDPIDPNNTFTSAGTFFGLAAGAAWILSIGGYQAGGPLQKRAVRYIVGLIGVLLFWKGLGAIFPSGDGFVFYTLRYFRYGLIGWWVAGGAPWVFIKFKFAERFNSI